VRIRRIRLVLPPRMRHGATGEARHIAETVAQVLADNPSASGPLRIEIRGDGRPARHMVHDLAGAATYAVRGAARREV
jgi:nucleoside-diphosphate-sugar epimerase